VGKKGGGFPATTGGAEQSKKGPPATYTTRLFQPKKFSQREWPRLEIPYEGGDLVRPLCHCSEENLPIRERPPPKGTYFREKNNEDPMIVMLTVVGISIGGKRAAAFEGKRFSAGFWRLWTAMTRRRLQTSHPLEWGPLRKERLTVEEKNWPLG